jgi:hypothetical protein
MTYQLRPASMLALALMSLVLAGCNGTSAIKGNTPQDRLNPTISAQQRAVLTRHKQQNGDLPSP